MNGASYKSVGSQPVPIAKIPSNFAVTYHEAFPIQADLSAKAKTQKGEIHWLRCASQSGVLW
jgi:hypothetical protein